MMITLVLSSNMKRMLKKNVLVRKLTGIETAGNLNYLFTDKTGTLTKGNLSVVKIISPRGKEYRNEDELKNNKRYYKMSKISLTLNNESVYSNKCVIGGNITDRAILSFFKEKIQGYKIISKIPFSSKNKYSSVKVKIEDKEVILIKGAAEMLLEKCSHYYENGKKYTLVDKKRISEMIKSEARKGGRIIAFCTSNSKMDKYSLLGLVCIKDEIRKEAIRGLKLIEQAGVNVIMITGDNIETAKSIGKEVELLKEDSIIIDSKEFSKLSDKQIKRILPNLKIIARALPQDKSKIVKLCQNEHQVVGMTGDGVNDAPALKKADVGFSMGSGTEVAKEASDIVIIDDNLISISNAILYGRTIFKSIRKFIIFQLTMNLCAVSISIVGPFIGIETPVTVVQMLWINMIMDTLAALAFSYEPALEEYMYEKPKKKNEQIINKYMLGEIIFTGTYSSLMCMLFLKHKIFYTLFRNGENDKYFMTAFFGLFIFMGIFNCFNSRTHRLNLLSNLSKNIPFIVVILFISLVQIYLIFYGGKVFRTYGLSPIEFGVMIIISLTVIPVDYIRKIYLRKRGKIGGT